MTRQRYPGRPPSILGKGHAHIDRRRNPKRKENLNEMNAVRDQLTNADTDTVYEAAYRAISELQSYEPGTQVAAVAVLFLAICDSLGVCMKDTLESANRMTLSIDKHGDHWNMVRLRDALKDYINYEIKRNL